MPVIPRVFDLLHCGLCRAYVVIGQLSTGRLTVLEPTMMTSSAFVVSDGHHFVPATAATSGAWTWECHWPRCRQLPYKDEAERWIYATEPR